MRSTMPARGQRVVRHPVDEGADFSRQRRRVELPENGAEPIVPDLLVRRIVPDDAHHLARAERHRDDLAGRAKARQATR